jgi:hypothetical protein
MCNFSALQGNTAYYFMIFPYTNGGANIDFKTDGTAPSASATTADVTVIEAEDFDSDWGNWQRVNVAGAEEWDRSNTYGVNNTPCARMSGFSGVAHQNEDWLISPAMNFDEYTGETFAFQTAKNYTGPDLEVLISNDYDGQDPTIANWTTLSWVMSGGSWEWTPSGDIDISNVNGTDVYVAFKFISNDQESATWEVDEIKITGAEFSGIEDMNGFNANFNIYPNPASESINISTSAEGILEVEIFSVSGSSVVQSEHFTTAVSIDVSQLPAGLYFIQFRNERGDTRVEKMIIEK